MTILLRKLLVVIVGLTSPFGSAAAARAQAYAEEPPAQRDARMAWWREARFGMFIHWGVYAVPAGSYDGVQWANVKSRRKRPGNE
jgi:hypothetical protein